VLQASDLGRAVAAAIQLLNAGAEVIDRGAYLRVSAPPPCVLTRAAVERITGESFLLPGDLEQVMPSFHGFLALDAEWVEWRSGRS
jgi:hypothetical protein